MERGTTQSLTSSGITDALREQLKPVKLFDEAKSAVRQITAA